MKKELKIGSLVKIHQKNAAKKELLGKNKGKMIAELIDIFRFVIQDSGELEALSRSLEDFQTKSELSKFKQKWSLDITKGRLIRSVAQHKLSFEVETILAIRNLAALKSLGMDIELASSKAIFLKKLAKNPALSVSTQALQKITNALTITDFRTQVSLLPYEVQVGLGAKHTHGKNIETQTSINAIYTPMGNKR